MNRPVIERDVMLKRGFELSLLDICAALHADSIGIDDGLAPDRRVQLRAYLEHRVETWHAPGSRASIPYDNAVLSLCMATLAEKHWTGARR